ncbi:glycosyltransferase family 2 protein [Thiomicrospira pelophila]|uniref:glycosyltransferase family 2 protein n=1 Tax=Thiomicrospira pelophila TaxID=934 RepID=UPI0004A70D15|nr:glycosyltransferase [Thiomicrospira pelophila]
MSEKLKISVIIPTYHDWPRLQLCLNALEAQTIRQQDFEILVVNNDPQDTPPIELKLPTNCQLLSEQKPGSYAARNAALGIAKGEVIAFTDSDCIPEENWLINAVERLQKGAERIAGRVELFFKSDKLTLAEIYEKAFAFDQESNAKAGGSVTANMITWRKHFDTVGWFNDSLMSGGDNEWGWRAKDLGIPIQYAPDVVVKHPARDSLKEIFQKQKRVSGGAAARSRSKFYGLTRSIIMGFLPPRAILLQWRAHRLTVSEKLTLTILVYIVKIYGTIFTIGVLFNLVKIARS